MKIDDLESLKRLYFNGFITIDDPIEFYTHHTLLHDAVMLDRQPLFNFLIDEGANLNIRDVNGYTPLLKAASIGRIDMCKRLIELGVDPRQTDPYGNTPMDKANLYNHFELTQYL